MSVDITTITSQPCLFLQNELESGYCVGTTLCFCHFPFVSLTLERFDRYLEASSNNMAVQSVLQQRGGANVFVRSYDKCRKKACLPINCFHYILLLSMSFLHFRFGDFCSLSYRSPLLTLWFNTFLSTQVLLRGLLPRWRVGACAPCEARVRLASIYW